MLNLGRTHDPQKNARLLTELFAEPIKVKEAVQETEQLFQQCRANQIPAAPGVTCQQPLSQKITEKLQRLFAKPSFTLKPTRIIVDEDENVFPDWKDLLDRELNRLAKTITRVTNVLDYGAVGDGKTDCTAAFKRAIGKGRVKVIVPDGVFVVQGIRLPSWTWLVGTGKGTTTIKLADQAPKGTRLITNANHWRGNHHIMVEKLSLDWNVERLGNAEKTSTGGNHSSCLTFAHVTYGWVKTVEAINPGLHGFDISSTLYNYAGDGYRARGSSKYVWLENLNGYGFGDDGITTHHSDYIFIAHSHLCDPSGRAHEKGFSNSNGIEIDDGSRNVLLVGNSTARCFGGVEIKAHQDSSAASNVQIVGHISVGDNRSYNFRHIGHHQKTDPESKSAHNITGTYLAAIAPVFTDLYAGSTPRGLVVSAYKNVVVNRFVVIGDPAYDYRKNPVAAIQYRAKNVILNRVTFRNFHKAGAGIKVFGGKNRADFIRIHNIEMQDCTMKPVQVGADIHHIRVT